MAQTVRRVEYYYVMVPNKPGSGAKVLGVFEEAGVNLLAYLGFPAGRGKSQIDLVPQNPAAFRRAAQKAGLKLSRPKRAFLVKGSDRVGAVAELSRRLAKAKVNVTAGCATIAGGGRYGMILWVRPAAYAKAARALRA